MNTEHAVFLFWKTPITPSSSSALDVISYFLQIVIEHHLCCFTWLKIHAWPSEKKKPNTWRPFLFLKIHLWCLSELQIFIVLNSRVCLKLFTRNSDVKAHILRVHCGDRRYPCTMCGKRFDLCFILFYLYSYSIFVNKHTRALCAEKGLTHLNNHLHQPCKQFIVHTIFFFLKRQTHSLWEKYLKT